MTISKAVRLQLVLCLCLLSSLGKAASDPVEFLRSTADYVFVQVEEHRAELEQDSSGVYQLVEDGCRGLLREIRRQAKVA